MTIISDFECPKCGYIEEVLCDSADKSKKCKECGGKAKRIISFGRVYTGNESAPWLKSVLEVVDKDSDKPHVREFVRNPTRSNYKNWMKKEGLRPMDSNIGGAPPVYKPPPPPDIRSIHANIFENHRKRNRLEIGWSQE